MSEAASEFPYFNAEGGRVRDLADILSAEVEQQLTAMLDAAEAEYGPQMGVVTVATLEGLEIDDFSLRYANAWGLGDKQRNDGLMLVVAPNERKVRIEVGLGIEDTFSDAFAERVLDTQSLPAFRDGQFEAGIIATTEALVANMRCHPTIAANDNPPSAQRDEVHKCA